MSRPVFPSHSPTPHAFLTRTISCLYSHAILHTFDLPSPIFVTTVRSAATENPLSPKVQEPARICRDGALRISVRSDPPRRCHMARLRVSSFSNPSPILQKGNTGPTLRRARYAFPSSFVIAVIRQKGVICFPLQSHISSLPGLVFVAIVLPQSFSPSGLIAPLHIIGACRMQSADDRIMIIKCLRALPLYIWLTLINRKYGAFRDPSM
ncbi:hypothetical protein F5141DRAFT_809268 [Pisolithus sp. B1]|nr:hypothetical protein F5141DRAFT_809268 [Pisolithus sp. B1]